jgi:GDP-L-fucose synthase
MDPRSRIYVAGHTGLAGSALARALRARGYGHLLYRTHAEMDLADRAQVREFFHHERPDVVFLAAARAGGIVANQRFPAEFIRENLEIQVNVIEEARRAGVKRLLFLAASCIYPRDCPQPMPESSLLAGPVEPSSRPYAMAKIAGIELCWAFNRQYGVSYRVAVPNNLYGPGDNYHPEHSQVASRLPPPASRGDAVVLWGTGTPRRELLHSDDMAEACVTLMELPDAKFDEILGSRQPSGGAPHSSPLAPHAATHPPLVNIGWGEDYTIRELAEKVRDAVGYQGRIEWDASKPDGTPRKLLDTTRMKALGWSPRTTLDAGIRRAYEDFLARHQAGKA